MATTFRRLHGYTSLNFLLGPCTSLSLRCVYTYWLRVTAREVIHIEERVLIATGRRLNRSFSRRFIWA